MVYFSEFHQKRQCYGQSHRIEVLGIKLQFAKHGIPNKEIPTLVVTKKLRNPILNLFSFLFTSISVRRLLI